MAQGERLSVAGLDGSVPRTPVGRPWAGLISQSQAHGRCPWSGAASSRNALKHGLSRPVDAAAVAALVAGLTRWLNGEGAAVGDVARHVAQARVELSRIHSVRDRLLIAVLGGGNPRHVRQLVALARYERPALARWSRALKRLAGQEGGRGRPH